MNLFNYLYYKLYQAALKSSLKEIPHVAASAWFGGLLGTNFFVINAFLAKTIDFPFLIPNPMAGGVFIAIIIVIVIFFFHKERRIEILDKFSQEGNRKRVRGNALTAFYVCISFLLIFAVAFYEPNKL